MNYYRQRPLTEALSKQISFILIEETNKADTDIAKFIKQTTERLVEVVVAEIQHGKR